MEESMEFGFMMSPKGREEFIKLLKQTNAKQVETAMRQHLAKAGPYKIDKYVTIEGMLKLYGHDTSEIRLAMAKDAVKSVGDAVAKGIDDFAASSQC